MTTESQSGLIGHDREFETVRGMAVADRLPHALLITGPDGVGKTSFALSIAADLTCLEPAIDGAGCGECRSCHLACAGNHPDIERVAPPKEETTIGQMRDLRYLASLVPSLSSRRIIIVERAETLNDQASNAILKVLEDAPTRLTLLLLAPSVQSVISTIRSRSIHIGLKPVPIADLEQFLCHRGATSEVAKVAASHAGGAPGRALTVAATAELAELLAEVGEWTERLAGAEPEAALKLAEELRQIADRGAKVLEASGAATDRQATAWVLDAAMSALGSSLAGSPDAASAAWTASAIELLNESRTNILHYAQADLQIERMVMRLLFAR